MKALEGKVALVTGGTGGIGTAICIKLADAGAKVVSTYNHEEQAREWQSRHAAMGHEFVITRCDVSSYDDCVAMADRVKADHGGVDILVNNAGITKDGTFRKMTPDQWNAVIDVNLSSVFNVTRQFVDAMTDKGWGRVINISSINGQKGQFGQTNYAAAKAGMHGFTMSLAQETARKGVTVNSISPGYIATEMVMAVPEDVRAKIIAGIPMGRLGKPEEIAALVAFLASDDAAFITGANIAANGGQHMM
ncbi:MAG TPA: acetoacetyl-CoA reductase [Thiobacillaceae bacterium]|nr:acetoacetyl-CoA reductase [Thiobacillaceae bacterium]